MKADVKSSGIAAPMAQPHQAGELGISLFPQFSDDLLFGANNFMLMLARMYEISEDTVFFDSAKAMAATIPACATKSRRRSWPTCWATARTCAKAFCAPWWTTCRMSKMGGTRATAGTVVWRLPPLLRPLPAKEQQHERPKTTTGIACLGSDCHYG